MVDYTLCANDECPIRAACWRFVTEPGENQSFALFPYDDGCDSFIEIEQDSKNG